MPMTTRPPTHREGGECLTAQPGNHGAPPDTPHATPQPPTRRRRRRNGDQPRSQPATRPGQEAGDGCPPGTIPSDRKYQLSADEREWVDRTVDSLGPLTEQDREFLGMILHRRRKAA